MKKSAFPPQQPRTVFSAAAATHIRNAIKIKVIPFPDHPNAALIWHQGMYATGIIKNAFGQWQIFESASAALAEVRKIRTDIMIKIERKPEPKPPAEQPPTASL